jgi:hypothetical protein
MSRAFHTRVGASVLAAGLAAVMAAVLAQASCAGPKACERNSDCDNAYCDHGECKRDCIVADVDCPPGYICNQVAQCALPLEAGLPDGNASGGAGGSAGSSGSGGYGGGAGGSAGSGGYGGVGGSTAGGGYSGGGGSGASGLHEFDRCQSDTDCASPLVCREMIKGAPMRCTRTCSTSSECMTGTRCTYGTGFCAFDDDGKVCGGSGQCVDACAALGYCTSICTTALDCPGGWGCVDAAGGQRACVRLDQLCSSTNYSACLSAAHCDEQTLLVSGCTIQCKSVNDCPVRASGLPPWHCQQNVCYRPDDVWGPLPKGDTTQWACEPYNNSVVNLCGDGLTFDTAPSLSCPVSTSVPTSGPCVQSCRYRGGCGYGWACVGVASVGSNRIGICVQTGFGEVGDACTRGEDCLFGLCQGNKCSRDCTADGVCPSGFSCVAAGGPTIDGMAWRVCM